MVKAIDIDIKTWNAAINAALLCIVLEESTLEAMAKVQALKIGVNAGDTATP